MYCERCGRQIDEALNFCSSCGSQLKRSGDPEQRSVLSHLITALIVVVTAGIGVLAGLLAILLDKVSDFDPILKFAFLYLAALVGISFMIMRQVSKLIDAKLTRSVTPGTIERTTSQPPVELPPRSTNPLDEFREPASVTDHTTRTLEKVSASRQ